jgi:putative ABC transport system permease protein
MTRWLRYFSFWRRDPARDASDEIGFHLDMRIRDLEARGHSPAEARRLAHSEFGNSDRVRDQVVRIDRRMIRRERISEWIGDLGRDARVGLRSLRASPAFSVTAVLCAALGIGVTSAIVSAAYSILVRPLPYADAERIVSIYAENTVRGYTRTNISYADFVSWRDENRAFASIGMWTWNTATLSATDNEAERVEGAEITTNLFQLLGVQPARGRLFVPGEDTPGQDRVVLLSDAVWRRRYAADTTLVGRTITVNGLAYTVAGIMKPSFNFPDRGQLWVPLVATSSSLSHGNRYYAGAIGRLNPGVTVEQGRADLHRVDADLVKRFPDDNHGWRADVVPIRDDLVGDLRQPLKVFLWAVALVLLMVCANVANLMLARGAVREREVAVRTALGASRVRLGRQLMTESLLVAALGGAIGVLIAWWGVKLLRYGFPDQTPPFFIALSLDAPTLLFISTLAIVTGLLFGVIPALRGTKVNLSSALRDGSRGAGTGLHRSRLRSALVVGEVALSVMLMIGAMLLVRSYRNYEGTDLGFDQKGILTARITLPAANYPTRAHSLAFYDRLLERLRQLPTVTSVGSAQGIPFSGWNVQGQASVVGAPRQPRGEEFISHYQIVTPDYFKTIGVSLVRGRWLTEADNDTLAAVALVNETMVQRVFRGEDPIGKRLSVSGDDPVTVVGIIRDHRHYRLPQPVGPATYYPFATWPPRTQTLAIRTTRDDPLLLLPELRSAVRAIDPNVALYQVQTLEEAISRSFWRQRLQGNVLAIFAAMALALACIGLYGVISYAVAQRTRELGVRMALGASRRNVLMLVFGQSGRLVIGGVALGLFGALFAVRLLETLLYGVEAKDVMTFATVPALLAAVALLAVLIPARRATRVDPLIAMRAE